MCVCVCVCVYVYTCRHTLKYTHTRTYSQIHTHMHCMCFALYLHAKSLPVSSLAMCEICHGRKTVRSVLLMIKYHSMVSECNACTKDGDSRSEQCLWRAYMYVFCCTLWYGHVCCSCQWSVSLSHPPPHTYRV